MAAVVVSLETVQSIKTTVLDAKVGGTVEVAFDPAKAKLAIDYSREDSLGLRISGEFAPPQLKDVTLSIEGALGLDGVKAVNGTLSWHIDKRTDAQMDVAYDAADGLSTSAKLTIRF